MQEARAIVEMQAVQAAAATQVDEAIAATRAVKATAAAQEAPATVEMQLAVEIGATAAAAEATPAGLAVAAIPRPMVREPPGQIQAKAGLLGKGIPPVMPEGHRAREIQGARARGTHRGRAEAPKLHNLRGCLQSLAPSPTAFGPS
jgi:hypothetical protein